MYKLIEDPSLLKHNKTCDSIQICRITSPKKALAYYREEEEEFAMAVRRAQTKSSLPSKMPTSLPPKNAHI